MTVHYIDTSAIIKRLVDEPDARAFRKWLDDEIASGAYFLSSTLADVEAHRVCLRLGLSPDDATRSLSGLHLRAIDDDVIMRAREVGSSALRSLDALHLSTALLKNVDDVVTYDDRMARAATASGLTVVTPRA